MSTIYDIGTDVKIRHFNSEDAPCIEFVVLSVLQEWGFLPSSKDQQELEALQSNNPFDALFVAEDENIGVVGCAGIARLDEHTCDLRKIYLLKRFRGKSIGKQLLEACVYEAKKHKYSRMRLEVNSKMALSAPFYSRNGFVIAKNEKTFTPSADLVYYKTL